jgi:hypothetical protein
MTHRRSQAERARQRSALAGAVEALEGRVFLAANNQFRPPVPPPVTPTSNDINDVKNGPMAAAGAQLIDLYRDYRKYKRDTNNGSDKRFKHDLFTRVMNQNARIGVTFRGRGTLEQLTERLRGSNAEIVYRSRQWTVVDAYVPIGQLHDLAVDPMIATMNPMYRPVTKQAGTADNQADFVQKTDLVRGDFGVDGTGVKIGVLSDSVNRFDHGVPGSIATGDLPQRGVDVVSDAPTPTFLGGFGTSTDEGRGMLELIHDIAPGADLAFASASFGLQAFADYIRALRAAGSTVIVDDIGFQQESNFQPSVIDQAIADVVSDGAVYLSSAGNSGPRGGMEINATWTKRVRDRFVDFDPGAGVDTRMRLNMTSGGFVVFEWDEPYNGVVGSAQTDLDVFLYDSVYGRKTAVAEDNNIRTGIPQEHFFLPAGEWDLEIHLENAVEGAPLPTRIHMFDLGGGLNIAETEYPVLNMSSIGGHAGGENTISIGAAPFFNPGENEDFSSPGPMTRMFDAAGNRLSAPVELQKPDVTGVDNTNTSFFGGDIDVPGDDDVFPNFSGTSAAAPNVAALVALMREVQPDATQADILDALKDTADPLNGSTGGWDKQGGFGLVDGREAIDRFVSNPTVDIVDVKDPRTAAIDSLKIVFSQRVEGFDLSDITLTRDGGPNLLTGAQTLQSTDGGRTWLLRNLRQLTELPGRCTATINATGSGITNTSTLAQPLLEGAVEEWDNLPFPTVPSTPTNLRAKVVDDGVVRLRWNDESGNEDYFLVQRALDDEFTSGLKSFKVPFDTTVFTDNGVPVAKRVFYRVRAVNNFSQFQGSTNVVEVFLPAPGDVILDNESSKGVTVNGNWLTTSDTPGFLGESYLSDENAAKGPDTNVRFTPTIAESGEYYVYARWTRASNRATNVPIDVQSGNGQRRTITVNQRTQGGEGWVLLGKFDLVEGRNNFVRVRTEGTNGIVTIDAVRFQPVTGAD